MNQEVTNRANDTDFENLKNAQEICHQNLSHPEIKRYLKSINIHNFSEQWERNIVKLLPEKYKKKHFALINLLLKEVREKYCKDMQAFVTNIILSIENTNEECPRRMPIVDRSIESHNTFLHNRNLLAGKYFLSLEIVKCIINAAHLKLPNVICDFEQYHRLGMMTLEDFQHTIGNDIRRGSFAITNRFYVEASKKITETRIFRDLSPQKISRIMRCVTNVFVQQILNIMIRSIEHIICIMDAGCHCPQILMRLVFTGSRLIVIPDTEEIFSTYQGILESVKGIGQDLIPLEKWLNVKGSGKCMKVQLPEFFVEQSHGQLQTILERLYLPVTEHVAEITRVFQPICTSVRRRILSLSPECNNFELYLRNVKTYRLYLKKANAMVANVHYNIGKLEQNDAKESLRKHSQDFIDAFVEKLAKYHREFNRSICTEFEQLREKALNVPRDAKKLVELTEYTSHASSTLVVTLERKIHESVQMLSALLDVTVLTEEHVRLNRRTINWLYEIEPVFSQNNTMTEAMKSELEDDMQRRINILNARVDEIVPQLSALDDMDDINRISEYVEYYKTLLKQMNEVDRQMKTINDEEKLFRFPETEFPKAIELKETILPFYSLIHIISQWQRDNAVWMDGPFEWLDAGAIERKTFDYFEQITELSRSFKSRIKMDVTGNKCFKFSGIADDPDPMQQPAPLKLCWQALNDINDFKRYLPLVVCMCNPALQRRHWIEMSAICDFDLTPNAGTSLRKIIAFNLMENIEKYQSISIGANRELLLQRKLSEMIEQWKNISFDTKFNAETSTTVFTHSDDIELLLGEHLTKIVEMQASSFVEPIAPTVANFHKSLLRVQEIIEQWEYIQTRRHSVQSIFSYPNIQARLREESFLNNSVNEILLDVQKRVIEDPTFQGLDNVEILRSLQIACEKLEIVSKRVKDYFDDKRLRFTRFFFLSDAEIQRILFETHEIKKLQVFLNKCFLGIQNLRINEDGFICAIVGDAGEKVQLNSIVPVSTSSNYEEEWLVKLEQEINNTVRKTIQDCYDSLNVECLLDAITKFPSMSIVCALQIQWTCEVHNCLQPFNRSALNLLYKKYSNRLISLVDKILTNITQKRRCVLTSLIIVVSHQAEILKLLLDRNISNCTDFEWFAQLRHYLDNQDVKISMLNASMKYGYEYNYYKQCIINTALTDRCFHALLQAHKYHFYGAVLGSTETGKTETVRSLARTMAVDFRVLNCSDAISYDLVCRVLKGHVSRGTWVCFESFHKLRIEVLSAIAQKIACMSQARSMNLKSVRFDELSIALNRGGHICAVMSTANAGYFDLPDNLKILFRTVAMMVPDLEKVAEVELLAAGFNRAKEFAAKLKILSQLFSDQLHCGQCSKFTISSIKSVIKIAACLKRNFPEQDEATLLLRTLIDIYIPKLCDIDLLTFRTLVHDMFPSTDLVPGDYQVFLDTFESVCESRGLHVHDVFKLKALQVFELLHIHRGLILVGAPFVGKTEILRGVANALLSLHESGDENGANVKIETITPSVVPGNRLFGHFDKSDAWKDGLCSKTLREFAEDNCHDRKWLVLDGPLKDPWIENLYTVLDENKTLQLMSGEKIPISDSTSVIFETSDLAKASPTILSRCGVVYVQPDSVDWRPFVISHLSKHAIYEEYEEMLYSLFDWAIDPCLGFIANNCSLTLTVGSLHMFVSALNLFEIFLVDACEENVEEKGKAGHFMIWAQAALIMALAWAFGGNLPFESHVKFNEFLITLWNGTNKEFPKPEAIKHFDIGLPNEGLVQDNFYAFKGIGNWKYWGDLLKNEKILEMPERSQVFVPTVNTMKYNYIFLKHVKHCKPFFLCGDAAVGKTFLMQNLARTKLPEEKYLSNFFSFTSFEDLGKAQRLLLSKLNKIKRRHYGPFKPQLCINFIEDLNTENCEETNNITELLRQYLNYGHFYDTEDPERIFIYDVLLLLALTIGREENIICPRFLRHFNIYTMYLPTSDTLFRIHSNVLFANLKRNQFAADVLSSVTSMTNATIDVCNLVNKKLRPVPNKFQYCFNLMDVVRVISGCSLLQKESVETKITFIRLWAHETWRVFGDRIIDDEDRDWLFMKIRETVKSHFKDSFETAFDYLPKFGGNQLTTESFNNLMFGNFIDSEKNTSSRRYEEIGSIDMLRKKVLSYLSEYNKNFKKQIDIVLSRYVLQSLVKISRILSLPCSNLLLISTVGSGRRSIASLAAYLQKQKLFEPSVQSYCDPTAWRNDLKMILKECGGQRKDVTLFLCAERMTDTSFRDVNSLLTAWEIPDLYSMEERQGIIEVVRLHAQGGNRNAEISVRAVMNYFTEECKSRLHIVLCLSPTDDTLRARLHGRSNLIRHCAVNWHQRWPEEALVEIGSRFVRDVNIQEDVKREVVKACMEFHANAMEMSEVYGRQTGRRVHATSTAFLHMMKLYTRLVRGKQEEIYRTRNRYLAGLEKLELAAQQVEQMKTTLTVLKPQLELSAQQTMITMKEVESENVTVERATILVKEEEEIANKKAEIAGALKIECEADLAVAIPILEDAVAALNTLKPTDITLVKAMKNPPDTVKLVMAAVCVMLGVPADRTIDPVTGKKYTDYWGPSKRILGDMNFLQNLKEYDKDNIPAAVMQVIKKTYMTDNSFMPHIVAKASSAAEGLCKWVRAMVSYDEVAKVVAPKKEKLLAAQKECDEAEAFLNEKRRTLVALNAKLAALNSSLQETLEQKLKLEKEVENCIYKLKKAENLIASLGGEKNRWMQCAETLRVNNDNLIGDMLLSSGIIVYTAPYSVEYRDKFLESWKECVSKLNIRYTKEYDFVRVLGVESEVNRWYLCGLPKNRFSTENAVIMNNSEHWCLFIDSQNQANQWIKAIEKRNDLSIIKLTDSDYPSIIKRNVQIGKPTLIENVGQELDVLLDPFLLKIMHKDGESCYLDTEDDVIEYCTDFRLYITTRLANPRYSYAVFTKLTIIDFSIPNEALQDRLLDIVMSKEKPELQEKFEHLLVQDASNKRILKQQEDNILSILSSTSTNILEDENAIQTLDTSKNLSLNVIKKQKAAKLTAAQINKFRGTYIQFVKYCTRLFNTLNALSELNHMYRFSFSWFIQLYVRSIETSNRSIVLEKRLGFLKTSFAQNLHSSVCRSLSEKHKILYSFLLCSEILLDRGQTTEEEIKFFMSVHVGQIEAVSSSVPDWLPLDVWGKICNVSTKLEAFQGLDKDFFSNQEPWKKYYNAEPLQNHLIPKPWIGRLSRFQTLLLVKTVRPDKIVAQIIQLIASIIGDTPHYSSQLKISESYAESSCLTPLVFVLPSCFSPLSLISTYASTKGYSSKFASLSMGEGQDEKAVQFIRNAQREGGWVFLQNCHLATHWIVELEKVCDTCDASDVSLDFRLWLSSLPIPEFPISVLQNSIKITHDHPPDFKQSLLNIYQADPIRTKEFFEGCPGKDKAFSKLLFSLCFFHITTRERQYYGIQGWNVPYSFDYTDLQISIAQLQDLINELDSPLFDTLWYLIGGCNYGGKITDEFDQRCLECLLRYYANPDMIKEQQYTFSSDMERLIPQRCEYLHVIKHIEQIPLDLPPQVFGSNENGVIIRDTVIATEFLSFVSRINQIPPDDDQDSLQDHVLMTVDHVLEEIPSRSEIAELKGKCRSMDLKPIERVLYREVELLSELSRQITGDLNNLKLAFAGDRVFSEPLEKLAVQLYKNEVPRSWRKVEAYIAIKHLSAYVDNLSKRLRFIKNWADNGLPRSVSFDAMFSCRMFLSAVSLTFSNEHKIPYEEIAFDFHVVKGDPGEAECSDSYFINGLYLSGAQWSCEREMLTESSTNIFWQEMPTIRFNCVRYRSNAEENYLCPVYIAADHNGSNRRMQTFDNYVISIPLKSDVLPWRWIKYGTAMYCQIP